MAKRRNPEAARLREEIKAKHRAATSKISRNRRQKGIDFKGTSLDPRVNASKIAKYTVQQLQAYGRRLDEFNSRSNQFVPGVGGVPLPRAKFNEYKSLEERHNSIGAARMNERGEFTAPGSGMSIREREESVRSKVKARGDVYNRLFAEVNRPSHEFNDVKGLERMIKDMEKKNGREFIPQSLTNQRNQARQMLNELGVPSLMNKLDRLTEHQFDILFNDTNFANTASLRYEMMKALASGNARPSDASMSEDTQRDIQEQLRWAAKLPKEPARGE